MQFFCLNHLFVHLLNLNKWKALQADICLQKHGRKNEKVTKPVQSLSNY